jgi:hypothetical protein
MFIADDAIKKPFGFREVPTSFSQIMIPIYFEHCKSATTSERRTIVIDKDHVVKKLKTR